MRGREHINIGQRGLHATRNRLVLSESKERIQPYQLFGTLFQGLEFRNQNVGFSSVPTVAQDQNAGIRETHAPAESSIEFLQ